MAGASSRWAMAPGQRCSTTGARRVPACRLEGGTELRAPSSRLRGVIPNVGQVPTPTGSFRCLLSYRADMVWDIHVRWTRHDERLILVKARWTALGSIQDISLDCGHGVHPVSVEDPSRREMNAFSKSIDGVFRWDDGVQQPEVFLTWNDAGEPGEKVIRACPGRPGLPVPGPRHPSAGLRTLLHPRTFTTARQPPRRASPTPVGRRPDCVGHARPLRWSGRLTGSTPPGSCCS